MPNIIIQHSIFHNDDVKLILEYPEELKNITELKQENLEERFAVFARILFDTILTKDRKEFKIVQNEETGEWEYLRAQTK